MTSTPVTPALEKSEVEAQGESKINLFILPCTGILLIFLGILLLYTFRRKQQEL
jgi:hypothetical protein